MTHRKVSKFGMKNLPRRKPSLRSGRLLNPRLQMRAVDFGRVPDIKSVRLAASMPAFQATINRKLHVFGSRDLNIDVYSVTFLRNLVAPWRVVNQ